MGGLRKRHAWAGWSEQRWLLLALVAAVVQRATFAREVCELGRPPQNQPTVSQHPSRSISLLALALRWRASSNTGYRTTATDCECTVLHSRAMAAAPWWEGVPNGTSWRPDRAQTEMSTRAGDYGGQRTEWTFLDHGCDVRWLCGLRLAGGAGPSTSLSRTSRSGPIFRYFDM
jgi:hypothetical protein